MLPYPPSGNQITCYGEIVIGSGQKKTYYKTVTLSPHALTVAVLEDLIDGAVMDDQTESI